MIDEDDPPSGQRLVEGDAETRERIAVDIHALCRAVVLADLPKGVKKEDRAAWSFNWLYSLLLGYLQTDLGVPHGSGEDASTWREDAARKGIDVSEIVGRTYAELNRDREQKRLFAEAVAKRALSDAKEGT